MAKRLMVFLLFAPLVFGSGCYFYTRGDYPSDAEIKQRLHGAGIKHRVAVNRVELAHLLDGLNAFESCMHTSSFEGLHEEGNDFFLLAYYLSAEQAPGTFNAVAIPYNWIFGIPNLFSLGFVLPSALKIRVRQALSVKTPDGHEIKKYVSEHDEHYYGWIVFVGYAYWHTKIEKTLFLDCVDQFAADLRNGKFNDYLADLAEKRKKLRAERILREKEAEERLLIQRGKKPEQADEIPASDVREAKVEPEEETEPEKKDPETR